MNKFFRFYGIASFFDSLSRRGTKGASAMKANRARSEKPLPTLSSRSRRLGIEVLEDRRLLSVSTAEYDDIRAEYDDFGLSASISDVNIIEIEAANLSAANLNAAIAAAGTTVENDLIVLRTTYSMKEIVFASAEDKIGIDVDSSQFGTFSIIGFGSQPLTIDGNGLSNVLSINGATVNLGNLLITGGNGGLLGGGISNSGTLTMVNCTVSENAAQGDGGGFYNGGAAIMTNCTVSDNAAQGNGGGIYNSGTLTMTNCSVAENTGGQSGGGIYSGGALTMTNCTVSENIAALRGGGIYCRHEESGVSAFSPENALYDISLYNCIVAQNADCQDGNSNGGDVSIGAGDIGAYNTLSSFTEWSNAADPDAVNYLYDANKPLFTDAESGNYSLCEDSQALDCGENSYVAALKDDMTGSDRIVNGTVDLGAQEYHLRDYAVIFSGGANNMNNTSVYYDEVVRLYDILVNQYGLDRANIYVIYADGEDPEADQNIGYGGKYYVNSDMSFAAGSTVCSATLENLNEVMRTLGERMGNTDHLLCYVADHGSGRMNAPTVFGEESVVAWDYSFISGEDFASAMFNVKSGYVTLVFTECFGGGILDNVLDYKKEIDPLTEECLDRGNGAKWYGMAAANHYETSWYSFNVEYSSEYEMYFITRNSEESFATVFLDTLENGLTLTSDSFFYAKANDLFAATDDYENNSGEYSDYVEHPWGVGLMFSIVSTNDDIATLPYALFSDTLSGVSLAIGQTLSVTVAPSAATVNYQWYRETPDGTKTAICGATSSVYVVTADDVGCCLSAEAAGYGFYSGVLRAETDDLVPDVVKSLVVDSLLDTMDSTDGVTTLREAIGYALNGETITFDADLAGGTITLSETELTISRSIVIDASNLTGGLTVSGGNASRVFYIDSNISAAAVSLVGLTITEGFSDNGGGIYNSGTLELVDCVVTGNSASGDGGGIYNDSGELTLTGCTISSNSAAAYGGGLGVSNGTATMINSRFIANEAGGCGGALFISVNGSASATNTIFAGNRAASDGGAIAIAGTLSLYNSTLAGNAAQGSGGGIFIDDGNADGSLIVYNSIIAQNAAGEGNVDVFDGTNGAALDAASSLSSYSFGAGRQNLVYAEGDPLFMYALPDGDGKSAASEWLDWLPYLTVNSAAVDSGNNNCVDSAVMTDYLSKPRIANNIVDRGAMEWQTHSFRFIAGPTTLLKTVNAEADIALAEAKAGTVIASFASEEFMKVNYSVTVNGAATDALTIDAENGNLVLAVDIEEVIVFKSIVITASETDCLYFLELGPFTLTVADQVIDLADSGVYKVDCDGVSADSKVTITDGEGRLLYEGSRNGGVIVLNGRQTAPETFILAPGAFDNMNSIVINSAGDSSISCRDTLILECPGDNNCFNVEGAPDGSGGGAIELNEGMVVTFDGMKNVFIDGSDGNGGCSAGSCFVFNSLDANLNISNMTGVALVFTSSDGSSSGIVLNMESQYHQSVLVGRQGTLRIDESATVTRVTLPNGRNVVSGNSDEGAVTVIDGGGSQARNVITLFDGENRVDVAGESTITAEAETARNEITVTEGTGTTVNLSKTTGDNIVSIVGDQAVYYGGDGSNDIVAVSGDNCILSLARTHVSEVTLFGDSSVVRTGAGDDVIEYSGSNGFISAGDGNDTIRVLADSDDNFIDGGAGNDFIFAALCSGDNLFYAGAGNDFIVGGSGSDTLFGNEGNNFLAGSFGRDKIVGGAGRDVLVGSMTSKLAALDEAALKAVFEELLAAWDGEDETILALLGDTSLSDGEEDAMQRITDGGIEIFFANSQDKDKENAFNTDLVYRN